MIDPEELANILIASIKECSSVREGLALFREVTDELDNVWDKQPPPVINGQALPALIERRKERTSWTKEDIKYAQELAAQHKTFAEIAAMLGRTQSAIYNAWLLGKFDHPLLPRRAPGEPIKRGFPRGFESA